LIVLLTVYVRVLTPTRGRRSVLLRPRSHLEVKVLLGGCGPKYAADTLRAIRLSLFEGSTLDLFSEGPHVTALPDNLTLLKHDAAGMTEGEIAAKYGVSQQAVAWRLNGLGVFKKGRKAPVMALLPWDLSARPDKRKLSNQNGFAGLRSFLRRKFGEELSTRAQVDLRAFLGHIEAGEVLKLDEQRGFIYVPRSDADGNLVIRWPEGQERPDSKTVSMFTWEADN